MSMRTISFSILANTVLDKCKDGFQTCAFKLSIETTLSKSGIYRLRLVPVFVMISIRSTQLYSLNWPVFQLKRTSLKQEVL